MPARSVASQLSAHTISEGESPMSLTIRRVVTGHDENGRAIVSIDESVKNVAQTRPGAEAAVIWTSEGFPVDNDGSADGVLEHPIGLVRCSKRQNALLGPRAISSTWSYVTDDPDDDTTFGMDSLLTVAHLPHSKI
jgi:hypothetical protein